MPEGEKRERQKVVGERESIVSTWRGIWASLVGIGHREKADKGLEALISLLTVNHTYLPPKE